MTDVNQASRLAYRSFCRRDDPVHAMRFHWRQAEPADWVVRDHACIALVERGPVRLESPSGPAQELSAGMGRVVPPGTPHRADAVDRDGAVECQLLVQPGVLDQVRPLLGGARAPAFPWQRGEPPVVFRLEPDAVDRFARMINDLMMRPPQLHHAVAALALLAHLRDERRDSPYADLPAWLRQGMIRLRSPAHLAEGLPALARMIVPQRVV